ncbi:prefoldin subunit 4 [Leptopilina heterotoma]|uniref:prefoldin subunit 4 n=1 Tax=Leptopilina heterotoma TaxID=63436 RepID=UPI001CA7FE58|nr:prefoldin subunit 4 [Leptopilina heterotoma]XP_051167750.1 prefoldin subunit 4 [Leptopilina boulardi]
MAGGKTAQGGFQPDSDVHITFEDQQKINKFAKQNAKMEDFKEELKVKQSDLQNLEDACDEIALLDDDVKIPFQFGEVFIAQGLEKTQSSLEQAKKKKQAEISTLETKCASLKEEMTELKAQLYAKFGSHINLEAEED